MLQPDGAIDRHRAVARCRRDSGRRGSRGRLRSFHDDGRTAAQRALRTRHRAEGPSRRDRPADRRRDRRTAAPARRRRVPQRRRGRGRTFAERLDALRMQADPAMLRERYVREIAKLDVEVERLEKKLANEKFVANAKPDVVAAERAKLDDYQRQRDAARSAPERRRAALVAASMDACR